MRQRDAYQFPTYSGGERAADAAVHLLGIGVAPPGAVWLLTARAGLLSAGEWLALLVYALGLGGMVLASAAYHMTRPGRAKEILRRIDHAVIYALIAGTYTPFAAGHARDHGWIAASLGIVWAVALAGIALKLGFPRRFERLGLALYLGLGWAMGLMAQPLWAMVPAPALALLVAGGIIYTAGTVVHLMDRLAYHNAVWHALVLAAAACHFIAVTLDTAA